MRRQSRFLLLTVLTLLVLSLLAPAFAAAAPGSPDMDGKNRNQVTKRLEKETQAGDEKGGAAKEQPAARERVRLRTEEKTGTEAQTGSASGLGLKVRERTQLHRFTGKVFLNGREFAFDPSDLPPVIKDGRVLIPVRAITRGLKAEIEWDPEARTVTVIKNDITVVLSVYSKEVWVNGEKQELEVPALLVSNRVLVPLRFLNQTLGCQVDYDQNTGDVSVVEPAEEETDENEGETDATNPEEEQDGGSEAGESADTGSGSAETGT